MSERRANRRGIRHGTYAELQTFTHESVLVYDTLVSGHGASGPTRLGLAVRNHLDGLHHNQVDIALNRTQIACRRALNGAGALWSRP